MKRFKKAIAVMLSMMLLFAFGMTANASESTEATSDQAIKVESDIQLTTGNEDVIKRLTRADKPDNVTSSVYVMQENLNFKTPETTSLKREPISSLKANPMAASATVSSATYSGTITQEEAHNFYIRSICSLVNCCSPSWMVHFQPSLTMTYTYMSLI